MTNEQIAGKFSLLAKLLEVHGGNAFKAKSYTNAAFTINKLTEDLTGLPAEKLAAIKGIGTSTAAKISELLATGKLNALDELIENTPAGILEMMRIKGIGPKKTNIIWKEIGIENVGELQYACEENRLLLYKGFGAKTQQSIYEAVSFFVNNKGSKLWAEAEIIAAEVADKVKEIFPDFDYRFTGQFAVQNEIVDHLDVLINCDIETIRQRLLSETFFEVQDGSENEIVCKNNSGLPIRFFASAGQNFTSDWIRSTSAPEVAAFLLDGKISATEEEIYADKNLPHLHPAQRTSLDLVKSWIGHKSPIEVIQPTDIRGLIHCHSTWSDGTHSLEDMAATAKAQGLSYMVITDHSRSAFYANGLSVERIQAQHEQIAELNKKNRDFKIFAGIESDILSNGNLDYEPEVLEKFDVVIASIHSNLKMNEEKATERLIRAIENPYTTILGHPTGRLLLSRAGYPINHSKVIDACVVNKVAIEVNSNPRRLDIDWRHLYEALDKGVMVSINPDAHSIHTIGHTRYGVLVAQKAGLTKQRNLSSMDVKTFEDYLSKVAR